MVKAAAAAQNAAYQAKGAAAAAKDAQVFATRINLYCSIIFTSLFVINRQPQQLK